MKIKFIVCGILLVIIFMMLVFGTTIKNTITTKLYKQLPNYSCSARGLCMKCYKGDKNC